MQRAHELLGTPVTDGDAGKSQAVVIGPHCPIHGGTGEHEARIRHVGMNPLIEIAEWIREPRDSRTHEVLADLPAADDLADADGRTE
jgi:hypothetical protein